MNEFKKKYITDFTLTAPADKGDLSVFLKMLVELKSEYGISAKKMLYCYKPFYAISISISYDDAMAVINGDMSEDMYVERNRRDKK